MERIRAGFCRGAVQASVQIAISTVLVTAVLLTPMMIMSLV